MIEIKKQTCTWIGDGECCQHIAIIGKAYCEKHYERVYTTFLPEMAQYIIDKEIEVGCG